MFFKRLVFASTLAALSSGVFAAPEIRFEGEGGVFNSFSRIDDDNGANINDSPRDGNGTLFGDVPRGTSVRNNFRVTNTGNQTLEITRAVADSSQYTIIGLTDRSLSPGEVQTFQIRYQPLVFGTRTLRVEFDSNDGDTSERRFTFRVSGTGTGPDLRMFSKPQNPANTEEITDGQTTLSLAAGTLFPPINRDLEPSLGKRLEFTVQNNGNRRATFRNARFTGTGAGAFTVTGLGSGLDSGNSRDFGIIFNTQNAGTYTATFRVDVNDERTGKSEFSFRVRGTVTGSPQIQVEGQGNTFGFFGSVGDGDTTTSSGNGTEFGNLDVTGLIPLTGKPFRINNPGVAPLLISSITSSNEEAFLIQNAPSSVAPGATATFNINFVTQRVFRQQSTVRINTNASDGVFSFLVGGRGTGPELEVTNMANGFLIPYNSNLIASAAGTDFGEREVGSGASTRNFTLRNVGTRQLRIPVATISTGSASFDLFPIATFNGEIRLDPDETFPITVNFRPLAPGTISSQLSIPHNGAPGREPFVFRIQGRGTIPGSPAISVSHGPEGTDIAPFLPSVSVSFPNTQPGGSSTRTITIENAGTAPLSLPELPTFSRSDVFSIVNPAAYQAGTDLPEGGSRTFQIQFSPTSFTSGVTSRVSIRSNDQNVPLFNFNIRGRSNPTTAPIPIKVSGGEWFSRAIEAGQDPTEDAGTVIGPVPRGTANETRTFQIANVGGSALVIGSVKAFPSDILSISGIAEDVEIGEEPITFTLVLDSESGEPGSYEAEVIITGTSPQEVPFTFPLKATISDAGPAVAPRILALRQNGTSAELDIAPGSSTYRVESSTDLGTWLGIPGYRNLSARTIRIPDIFTPASQRSYFRAVGE